MIYPSFITSNNVIYSSPVADSLKNSGGGAKLNFSAVVFDSIIEYTVH